MQGALARRHWAPVFTWVAPVGALKALPSPVATAHRSRRRRTGRVRESVSSPSLR